jgi:hypothetical protein
MSRKLLAYPIFVLVIIVGIGGSILFSLHNSADAQEQKLWNLQKLEEVAETGDVEAQLRLRDFYSKHINSRDYYKKKLEYWNQKIGKRTQTSEYMEASKKLNEERAEERRRRQEKQDAARARLQAMKEKYEKLGPDYAKKNEAQVWHDGLNAIFNIEKIYSWKVPYKWRYRYTIDIETPEGIKSGITVREVFFPPADKNIYVGSNKGVARGEAVYIDLGQRGVVFAIMQDTANARNRFKSLVQTVFPTVPKVYDQERYQEVLKHYHNLRGVKGDVPPRNYPMFVHFKDLNDPQSIELVYERKRGSRRDMEQVDADRFEEVFGEGVRIKNITMEMTDEPLEWKLENKLRWIESMSEKDITQALRKASPRIHMINSIGHYVFRQGQQDPLEKMNAEKKAKKEIKNKLSKYKAYGSYKEIPWFLGKDIYHTVTLDQYLKRVSTNGYLKTSEEHTAAMKAFVTVDKNKDGKISYHESEARNKDRRSITMSSTNSRSSEAKQSNSEVEKLMETVSVIKSIDSATLRFRDVYNARPGDMPNANKRLPNCSVCGSGNGDKCIGDSTFKRMVLNKDERHLFWVHLSKAGLIKVKGFNPDGKIAMWGETFLSSPIGGGFQIFYYDGKSNLPHVSENVRPRKGHYIILTNDLSGDLSGRNGHFLTPKQASWIDRKIDDGSPLTGKVIAAGNKACLEKAGGNTSYRQTSDDKCLSLYIRIKN